MSLVFGYVGAGMLAESLYPFSQVPFEAPGFARVEVRSADQNLPVYVHDAGQGAPVVLYFMGNRGTLDSVREDLEMYADGGRSVIAMTYRGGGGEPGEPTEAGLKADALFAFDAIDYILPSHGAVVPVGYSLGTGLALHVAANREADGLILVAPYSRVCDIASERVSLPVCNVPWLDRWQSTLDAPRVAEDVLLLHGLADSLIPAWHSTILLDSLPETTEVEAIFIEGGEHTTLPDFPVYAASIDRFLDAR
ncbi:alpha/beta hydrolase [Pelagovum pacificum]|nr:alpha/beta hydrolase [Pelagovum pacificum]